MGMSPADKIHAWINDIPDSKLDSTYAVGRPAHLTQMARLDCQGVTTAEPKHFNLQVQINKQCKETTMKKLNPDTVAWSLADIDPQWTPTQIKETFKATVTRHKVMPPKVEMGEKDDKKGKEDEADKKKRGRTKPLRR